MPANHSSADIVWMLLCAALVMLMQAGFCCLETGLSRTKNSVNVAVKNLFDFVVSSIVFWCFGFGLMFGDSWFGIVGTSRFAPDASHGSWILGFLFFQLVFCGTSTTIISGAVAERMRFSGYLIISLLVSAFFYPVFGHWAWGGGAEGEHAGWLARLGFIDFAGSTVVHSMGGWLSLAAVLVIGPRLGRFDRGPVQMHGHNYPLAILGVFLLWFGWFGFNGGSTLGVTEQLPTILLNTNLAAAGGGAAALFLAAYNGRRLDVGMAMNGCLAGLVSITASCHLMTPACAIVIGAAGGVISVWATQLLETYEIDDVVGAIPVHAVGGVWGTLAVALLAPEGSWGSGLSRTELFSVQCLGISTCFAWAFGVGYLAFSLLDRLFPLRVSAHDEQIGLNVVEHGANTELIDLLQDMDAQRRSGVFQHAVRVEPHTEVGQIAGEYNRVLERVQLEIASREAAVAAVQAAEARFRSIFENALWGIFQTSPQGQYLAANPALARMYGYDSPEHMMTELNDISRQLYVDPNRRRDFADQMRRNKVVQGFESLIRRRDGSMIWISENARAIHDDQGRLLYYEGTVEDVTRRRETEALRQETETAHAANAAKSAFLANMSHEIRTPLNGVIGMLDLMSGTTLDERQARYLRVSRSSAHSLLTLINDILDFSKIEAGKLELSPIDFDLTLCVEDVMEIFAARANEKGLELACRVDPGLPSAVHGDSDRLRQVLINLMGNAVKFTEQGEVVLRVSAELDGDRPTLVRFEVSDTGIGIPQERLDRLFRAFSQVDASTTRKFGGTGLGLAISRQLVELMGGRIEVRSEPGKGSTFSFTVRLEPGSNVMPGLAHPAAALAGLRVLVVDDNATNREILSEQLGRWGCKVAVCSDPRQSIALMRHARASADPYGLVVLDHLMPDIDGLELATQIKADGELAPTPLLMLTSLGNLLTPDQVKERQLAGFITKPVRQSQLLDAVMTSLGTPESCSTAPAGSCITPMRETAKRPSAAPLVSPPRKMRLLVAEDNEVNQLVVREMLERAGYEVTVVVNGKRAVETVMIEAFDLVLMDCQMPEMDGLEATRLIRQMEGDGTLEVQTRRLPILALTANAFDADRQRCKEAGMDGHVAKPIDVKTLLAAIQQHAPVGVPPSGGIHSGVQASPPEGGTPTFPPEGGTPTNTLPAAPPVHETHKPSAAEQSAPANRTEEPLWEPPFVLTELTNRCLGDAALAAKVVRKFLAQLPTHQKSLARTIASDDLATVASAAHALKGAAANLAARRLAKGAAELEKAARDGQSEAIEQLYVSVMHEIDMCQGAGEGIAEKLSAEMNTRN